MAETNHPLITVLERSRSYDAVVWALDTQWYLAEKALLRPGAHLAEGQVSPFGPAVAELRLGLDEAHGRLSDAHHALLAERTKDAEARDERDAAEAALLTELAAGRSIFQGAYSPENLEVLGFTTRMPNNPKALVDQAEFVNRQIVANAAALPKARSGISIDAETFLADCLRPATVRLKRALARLGRERKVTETAVLVKDSALGAFNVEFFGTARVVEALFKKAGLDTVAARVRPSTRRLGTTVIPFPADPAELETDLATPEQDETPAEDGGLTDVNGEDTGTDDDDTDLGTSTDDDAQALA